MVLRADWTSWNRLLVMYGECWIADYVDVGIFLLVWISCYIFSNVYRMNEWIERDMKGLLIYLILHAINVHLPAMCKGRGLSISQRKNSLRFACWSNNPD